MKNQCIHVLTNTEGAQFAFAVSVNEGMMKQMDETVK